MVSVKQSTGIYNAVDFLGQLSECHMKIKKESDSDDNKKSKTRRGTFKEQWECKECNQMFRYELPFLKHRHVCGKEMSEQRDPIFKVAKLEEANKVIVETKNTKDGTPISRIKYIKNNRKKPSIRGRAFHWECLICKAEFTIRHMYYNHMRRRHMKDKINLYNIVGYQHK